MAVASTVAAQWSMRLDGSRISPRQAAWRPPISAADACRRRRLAVGGASGRARASSQQDPAPPQPPVITRLFSNLNADTLRHEPGTVWGAAALVAGTTVGAGILALPAVTQASGFAASSVAILGACLYSIITGLLLAEVNVNTLCELGAGRGVSISSMARRTLGDAGATAVSLTYALLHFALLVAYIAKAGETLQQWVGGPLWAADAAFAALFGGLCYASRPATLDALNSALVAAVVASFVGLVGVAASDIRPEQLATANWGALPDALPVIALSYVFQNIVPQISSQLEGDLPKIRQAIVLGVAVPCAMFLVWNAAVLGSSGGTLLLEAGAAAGGDPLAAFRLSGGPVVATLIDAFTFLAVASTFVGFVLALTGFLADVLRLPTGNHPVPYALTLGPTLALAISFGPAVFLDALDFAGTYGVLVLFGLMPAAMAWSERYSEPPTTLSRVQALPGGKLSLLAVGGAAGLVIARELLLAGQG